MPRQKLYRQRLLKEQILCSHPIPIKRDRMVAIKKSPIAVAEGSAMYMIVPIGMTIIEKRYAFFLKTETGRIIR